MILFSKLNNVLRLLKFIYNVMKEGVFAKKNTEQILNIILILAKSEWKYYNKKVIMSRTIETSVKLLESLIETYKENHSEVTLDQILQVIKEEFIKRK